MKRCYLKQARSANGSAGPVVLLVLAAGLIIAEVRFHFRSVYATSPVHSSRNRFVPIWLLMALEGLPGIGPKSW